MNRTFGVYLDDMIEYGKRAVAYLDGRDLDGLLSEPMRMDAIARAVEIMGEASKRMPADFKDRFPQIPWKDIARTRDRYAHRYNSLNWRAVWETVSQHVPAALVELEAARMIHDAENPPPAEPPA
jgi:uncharacterized protein with HEPN domain